MKRLLVVLMTTMLFSSIVMADTITIVADEWAPYNADPNSSEPGYGIEIAQLIFKEVGHTVAYKVIPWNRAIKETREGTFTAIIGAFKEDAPDFIFPEEEFGISVSDFFGKTGSTWKYKGLESLLNVKIGLIKDYAYGEELDKFFKKHPENVDYTFGNSPLDQNIQKLLGGRIDIILEDVNVFKQKAKEMGVIEQIVSVGRPNEGDKIFIAFSPKNAKSKEYAEILSKGIKKLHTSGELDKILSKYGLKYWK